jgi:PAS domain S-box-containing protein
MAYLIALYYIYDLYVHAEEAVRASEKKYRDLVDNALVGIYKTDIKGNIIYVNEALSELFGFESPEEMMSEGALARYKNPEDREALIKTLKETGTAYNIELELFAKDGNPINVLFTATLEGESLSGTVLDITERKRAEKALRESEEKFRTLLNSTAEAIYGIDANGNCTFCNSSFLRLTGYETKEDVLGGNIHELIHHTRADGTKYPMEESEIYKSYCIGEGLHVDDEVIWRADGSSFYAEYWCHSVLRGEEVLGAVVTFIDITERKQAEAKVKVLAEELGRSNRELENFAAVASHDLQSPILSVMSSLNLFERQNRGRMDKESEEYIKGAKDRASNMLKLIRSLLRYSRLDTGSGKFEPADCEAVLKQGLASLKVDIEESGAMVTHDPLPEVTGDASLLSQVFQNLIANAIKFRGEEPPLVHVSAKLRGREWVFSVRDNGVGVAPEYTGRIFVLFQRLHDKGVYSGSGIGLSTCKRIVELHGGRIWVESEPGRGSTFFFTIPTGGAA